jgi:hypothetical protein
MEGKGCGQRKINNSVEKRISCYFIGKAKLRFYYPGSRVRQDFYV